MDKIVKWPVVLTSASILAGLVLALWIARAPTSYTGKVPILGDSFPIDLNAVYIIIFGPVIAAIATGVLWFLIDNIQGGKKKAMLLQNELRETAILNLIFVMIFALSIALSLQYFLILAPEKLCASRPHFDFLWTNVPGPERITHCMSGTKALNEKAPYYLEPQILQSWGQIVSPMLTLLFLVSARRAWIRMLAKP